MTDKLDGLAESVHQHNTTTTPQEDTDSEQRIHVLLQSLDLVARLAAMDTDMYSRTLALQVNKGETDCNNAAALQMRVDELQSQWKLETTAIPNLISSIHRLHSTCIQLASQSDQLATENQALTKQHVASTNRILKLEVAIQKLYNKNQRLKQKLSKQKSEQKSLFQNVKTYVRAYHKQELQLDQEHLASQVMAHERVIMAGNRSRTSSLDQVMVQNRSRTSSRDTTFSDLDAAAMYPLDEFFNNDSYSVASSVSSSGVTSLITDEGIATLRLELFEPDDEEIVLHYPANTRVGLQFYRMQLQASQGVLQDPHDTNESTTPSAANFSSLHKTFDSFLGRKVESSALVVCGHFGFDETLNLLRPCLGSCLVAVNGESLDEGVSFAQIRSMTHDSTFTLSFRRIPLTAKQKDILDHASKTTESKFKAGALELMDGFSVEMNEHEGSSVETNAAKGFKEMMEKAAKSAKSKFKRGSLSCDVLEGGTDGLVEMDRANDVPKVAHISNLELNQVETTSTETAEFRAQEMNTTPAVKLRKQMQSVGLKFKSLF